ncbi:MAG: type I-D CRISPR-associated helicase Cas3' [Chloroflexota bacterium]|nr:type I-D CRISPR-associated helicase Cas3' [Chloroflexota bacterium]
MKVHGYNLALHPYPGVKRALYPHQAVILDKWEQHAAFLLITKTGSGKTAAAALPFLLRTKAPDFREGAVFVYPTNALIKDQERSIRELAKAEGIQVVSLTPETAQVKYSAEQVVLVRIDANRLAAFAKAYHFRKRDGSLDKGRALAEVLRLDRPKIVLINPDILYLVYTLAYRHSAESVATLQAYQTLVFDEFHLYGGVELAHALFLIHLARSLHTFKRVLLLSATPDAQTREWIERLLAPYVVDADATTPRPASGQRQVAHLIDLQCVNRGSDVVETAGAQILALRDTLRALRAQSADSEYIPGVVILNSVVNAIQVEDLLVANGFARDAIASVRGLVSRAARDVQGKTLVVGTSAIEVGIDFKCDYLIFEAGDAAGFMQRFGRVGRHQPGIAYLLESSRVAEALATRAELSRNALEQQVYALYDVADARPWFVGTEMGLFTVFAQANHLRRRAAETYYANPERIAGITNWIEGVLDDYAIKMGLERKLLQVRKRYERLARGSKREQWIHDYEAIDTFRTSLPSAKVYDKDEAERRGCEFAKYTVDIYTLVRKAHQFRYNENTDNMVVYGGWEKPHRVYFLQAFSDDDCGSIKTTADYPNMVLFREGHKTSVSYSLVKPHPHIFIVLPKDIRPDDWRLAVFPCGEYIVAFDGDALLLREIWNRKQAGG